MTKEDLRQYRSYVAEIEELNKNIRAHTVHDTVKGSDKAYPYIQHTMSVKGLPSDMIHETRTLKRLQRKTEEICAWVNEIPDSVARRGIKHKYIYGDKAITWNEVVKKMYPNLRTDKQFKMTESIKKRCARILNKI